MLKCNQNLRWAWERLRRFGRANWFLSLFVAGVFLLICQPFAAGRVHASFDWRSVGIPSRAFYAVCLEQGRGGFWMPFFWRGMDHVGFLETGMFHPLHFLLYRFLPFSLAICLEMVLPFPICLLGGYLLLRRVYQLNRAGAFFGAALFAFSIFPLAHFGQVHMNWIFAHVPWLALAAEKVFRDRQAGLWAGSFAVFSGSTLLLCHPQTAFLALLPTAIIALYRSLHPPSAFPWRRRLGLLVVAGMAGLLIGMVQLWPTLAALRQAERGQLTAQQRNNFSLHPLHLVENLVPGVYGSEGLGDWVRHPGKPTVYRVNASEFSAYFGIGLLTLLWCTLGVCRRPLMAPANRSRTLVAVLVGGLLLLLTAGGYGGIHSLLGYVPLVSQFRSANRYKLVLSALLCVAAALSLARLSKHPAGRFPRALWVWVFVPAAVSLMVGAGFVWLGELQFRGEEVILQPWKGMLWGGGVSLAVTTCFILAAHGRSWALPVLAVLCFGDVAAYGLPKLSQVEYRSFGEIEELRNSLQPRSRPYRVIANQNFPVWQGQYMTTGYLGMNPETTLDLSRREHLQLASIGKAYLSPDKPIPVRPRYPRFRLVPSLVKGTLNELTAEQVPTVAYATRPGAAPLDGPPLQFGEGIEVLFDGYDEILLRVDAKAPRILVNSDRWTTNWQATIDDQPVDVLPLFDGAMRGLRIPAGTHEVRLYYVPREVIVGSRMTMVGLVLVLVLWLAEIWRRRRKPDRIAADA